MLTNPQDFSISSSAYYGNWGARIGHTVCVTHLPTNTSVTRIGKTEHRAKTDAYVELLKILDTETDTFKQIGLF